MNNQKRTMAQLQEHYEIEKELASKLREATKEERRFLYTSLYNELFQRVPSHPQLTQKKSAERTLEVVTQQMKFLRRFLKKEYTLLEIGPGDCALSLELTRCVKQVFAIDVSDEIVKGLNSQPLNFKLHLSDGVSIPVAPGSIDIAYSNQLMEHLHPEDALEQLRNINDSLTNGGIYICVTPNSLDGPHDISRYFEDVAKGFHLKEYTRTELVDLFMKTGFSSVKLYAGIKGFFVKIPLRIVMIVEMFLGNLPGKFRKRIAQSIPFRQLVGGVLVGVKLNR